MKLINVELLASKFHSRKAILYLLVLITGTVAMFLKVLDGGQWVELAKWSTTAYLSANAIDGFSDAIAGKRLTIPNGAGKIPA
jgi:hypothetical protein